jgi:hypothetical protein
VDLHTTVFISDGRYEVKSFATDSERNNVSPYAVFSGTHSLLLQF